MCFDVVLRFLVCKKSLTSAPLFRVTFSFVCMRVSKASVTSTLHVEKRDKE